MTETEQKHLSETLLAITDQAHALSAGSDPARPNVRSKAEQVAALVRNLASTIRMIAFPKSPPDNPMNVVVPALDQQKEVPA